MKAIRTKYKGILFRSKLEAQWAKFFDFLEIPWIYEPEGFKFEDGTMYLPDFFLPDSKQWFEVKGIMNNIDKHKIEMLCKEIGHDVVVGYANGEFEMCDVRMIDWPNEEPSLCWYSKEETYINRCGVCKKHSFMNSIGSYACQCCGAYDGDHYVSWDMCGYGGKYYGVTISANWMEIANIDIRKSRGNY